MVHVHSDKSTPVDFVLRYVIASLVVYTLNSVNGVRRCWKKWLKSENDIALLCSI